MERSLLKGRWGSSAAARQYIQEGLSILTKLSLSSTALRLVTTYSSILGPAFSSPSTGDVEG